MNFFTFAKLLRAVLLAALLMVGAVWLSGCGVVDEGGGSGSYESVSLGGKKWMSKNLNKSTTDSKCWGGSKDSCAKYGRLYTWAEAKSVCQSVGWRLPSREDWNSLVAAAGGADVAGKALKSQTGWSSARGGSSGDDTYGFTALPGGYYELLFFNAGAIGTWWTSTESNSTFAYSRSISYLNDRIGESESGKSSGYSVRCIQDE